MRAVRRDTRRLGDGLDVQPPLEQLLERLLHLLGADEAELRLRQDLIERRPGLARRLGAAKPSVGVDVAPIATPPGVLADLGPGVFLAIDICRPIGHVLAESDNMTHTNPGVGRNGDCG